MTKKVLLILLLLSVGVLVNAQSACDNSKKVNKIESNDYITKLKFYWTYRCACEEGNSNGNSWDGLVGNMNRFYDYFKDPSVRVKYKGPISLLPDKKITVSECEKNQRTISLGQTTHVKYGLDCSDESRSFQKEAKDPQQYGKAFFRAYCECLAGVNSQDRANQLVVDMKINHKNYHTYKESGEPIIKTLPASKCSVNTSSGTINDLSKLEYLNTPPPAYAQTNLDKLKDKYIQTFNPDGYSAYSSGQSVKYQGLQMAKNLSSNLDRYWKLIKTMDAAVFLADFLRYSNHPTNSRIGLIPASTR